MRIVYLLCLVLSLSSAPVFGAGESCSIAWKGVASKEDSIKRFKELRPTLEKSWANSGFSQAQIDDMVKKLQDGIDSGNAAWSKGNFRYTFNDGGVGEQLIPSNMQNALRKAHGDVAQQAAKLGDEGAKEVVKELDVLKRTRDQVVAQVKKQNWPTATYPDGRQAVRLKELDTSTELGRRLAGEMHYIPGREVVMTFDEEGTKVILQLLDSNGQMIESATKSFSASEFYQMAFK